MQTLWALGAGLVLGFVYDVLRVTRRKIRKKLATELLDLLFWISAALLLFVLGMGPGRGRLRMFMIIAAVFGGSAYFLTLGRYVRAVLTFFADAAASVIRTFSAPAAKVMSRIKIFIIFAKNSFKKAFPWYTINSNKRTDRDRNICAGGKAVEAGKGKYFY